MSVTFAEIEEAAERLTGQIVRTPLVPAPRLSLDLGCTLSLKLENQQATGSFKDRGALLKLLSLDEAQQRKGVIAMSAGNHAQGVAFHAKRLGIPATIVMPEFAPILKVERTRAYGARVVLIGETLDASAATAREIAAEEGLTFVHPYDDPAIIAGQGTIGLEILTDQPDLEAIVVPIGGGGLLSGIAIAAKAMKPEIKLYGVEVELFPSMYQALNDMTPTAGGATLADGIAVKMPGQITREIVRDLVEEIILVDETAIEQAICTLAEQQKVVAEGAGAAGVAALMSRAAKFRDMRVASVICGGNIDSRILSAVLARGLLRDGRMARLRIAILDRPGTLAKIAGVIGRLGGNIIEVYHQRMFSNVPVRNADIDIIIESKGAGHVQEIMHALKAEGFSSRILHTHSDESVIG